MYNELIYHLDLCILAYHLHSQTLIWPMDPYYEKMAIKGIDRRTNFMKKVRTNAGIILNNRNLVFPDHLDPILYDYSRINPHRPSFVRPLKNWIVYNTPSQITDKIRSTYMKRTGQDLGGPINQSSPDGATDDLYCFEGETGGIVDESGKELKAGANSMMGFVLARQIPGEQGDYDVHIVFRGSRSGYAARAFLKGKFREKGNPDWITDMDYGVFVQDRDINQYGKCCRGFRTSVKSMLPNILDCLIAIYRSNNKKPPSTIYVTGHSLGGALACHFTSAMVLGANYGRNGGGDATPNEVGIAPWHRVKLYTYGAPIVGDESFANSFSGRIHHTRIFVAGDDVVAEGKIVKVSIAVLGKNRKLGHANADVIKLENNKKEEGNPHEPFKIRRQLIRHFGVGELDNVPVSGENELVSESEPWKVYESFKDALNHPMLKDENKNNIQGSLKDFQNYLIKYLKIQQEVLGMNSSYKAPIKININNRTHVIGELIDRVNGEPLQNRRLFKDWWQSRRSSLEDDSTHAFLALCYLLRELSKEPNTDTTPYEEWIGKI